MLTHLTDWPSTNAHHLILAAFVVPYLALFVAETLNQVEPAGHTVRREEFGPRSTDLDDSVEIRRSKLLRQVCAAYAQYVGMVCE